MIAQDLPFFINLRISARDIFGTTRKPSFSKASSIWSFFMFERKTSTDDRAFFPSSISINHTDYNAQVQQQSREEEAARQAAGSAEAEA